VRLLDAERAERTKVALALEGARQLATREGGAAERVAALQGELALMREQVESLGAEKQLLLEDRAERERLDARVREQQSRLESLETERTELLKTVEELKAAAQPPEAVLEMAAELEQLQSVVEELQKKLATQDTELGALRRAAARAGGNPVQEIYERANAELNAVKNELSRRTGPPGPAVGGAPARPPPASNPRPRMAVPALDTPLPSAPKKAGEHE
jgi:chromosome segregation ATPase